MYNGERIAFLRNRLNISQNEMAVKLRIGKTKYKELEMNYHDIHIEELNRISNFFGVSLDYLLNLTNNPTQENFQKEIDYKYLAFSLKHYRKLCHITQKEIAHLLNAKLSLISKAEKNPRLLFTSYIYKYAKKFNVSVDYMCGKSFIKDISK